MRIHNERAGKGGLDALFVEKRRMTNIDKGGVMADKYKVETLSYTYEWLDVGPGPRECGNVLRMSSMLRNYRKTYHDLKAAVKEFEKLRKRLSNDVVIIISKLIKKSIFLEKW